MARKRATSKQGSPVRKLTKSTSEFRSNPRHFDHLMARVSSAEPKQQSSTHDPMEPTSSLRGRFPESSTTRSSHDSKSSHPYSYPRGEDDENDDSYTTYRKPLMKNDFQKLAETAADPRYSHFVPRNLPRNQSSTKLADATTESDVEDDVERSAPIERKDDFTKLAETANDPKYAHLFSHLRPRHKDAPATKLARPSQISSRKRSGTPRRARSASSAYKKPTVYEYSDGDGFDP
ncbi:hypothetical protein F4677DRAFT_444899 [Hypoxylon crocopeplum]|nr:hypothetical protein F4677DRAFT_444899 [Hypoxylon crocopeplum]